MVAGRNNPAVGRAGEVQFHAALVALEIGSESDLRLALDTFPGVKVQYIIDFKLVDKGNESQIRDTVQGLVDAAGPDIGRVSFVVPDIEYGAPDGNVRAIVNALRRK